MRMTGRLAGKTALITGGTSGIGKATALLFAQEGADVAFTGRRAEHGVAVASAIEALGVGALYIPADHTNLQDCEKAVQSTIDRFGAIDILFNNAGIVTHGGALDTTEETWYKTLDLNVTAVWRMIRLVLPHMLDQGRGSIVNNASDWGVVGAAEALAYAVSKGAVVQITRSVALEYAARNIRVNAVCPGDTFVQRWVEQGYFEASDPVSFEQALKECGENLPIGRVGKPEEIAQAVLFLASDESSFVTGTTLLVDGGNTAR
jgi:NAD(P)-dependent dehydrogenase (short-subunit alcohol dehydrogenase family)